MSDGATAGIDSVSNEHRPVVPTAPAGRRARTLVAAIVVGGLSAMVSAIVTMAAVWLLLDSRSTSTKGLIVFVGTAVGAAAGGWWSQPLVARSLAALSGRRGDA
ncbi:hypothetical protein I0C86_12090 [Plantactinospora sp. S1510]|uniref:Uncharacterized protein n=1 Tax=Plantactinospora alkalitolerans TaxID=2789879 RepID=A0ABS0GU04_9ACTN|nr:hypothetical protein [Plantactinospora alkalitolerans]MBF9129693.1 hypothetical protein [Plantactinospora alkalitolerans]